MKNEKGITLIALIITIIVMLILVAVTINVALNGGLFDRANKASKDTQREADKEELFSGLGSAYDAITGILEESNLKQALGTDKWTVVDNGDGTFLCTKVSTKNAFKVEKTTAKIIEMVEQGNQQTPSESQKPGETPGIEPEEPNPTPEETIIPEIYARMYEKTVGEETTKTLVLSNNEDDFDTSLGTLVKDYGDIHELSNYTITGCNDTMPASFQGDMPGWISDLDGNLKDAKILNRISPQNTAGWFLFTKKIDGLENLNTSNVTNMAWMFGFYTSEISFSPETTTSLDLSSFNTTNVTDMQYMFFGSTSLSSIVLTSFNTANVTNMEGMFGINVCLTSLNISNFNTSSLTNARNMFNMCASLSTLSLGNNFNTTNVTDMSGMFFLCQSMKTYNLVTFNTTSTTSMDNMFDGGADEADIYISNSWEQAKRNVIPSGWTIHEQ